MNFTPKLSIALISFHADPSAEIGMESAGGQNIYVRQIGRALAQQGWSVDLITRKTDWKQPNIVSCGTGCRIIRLTAGPQEFIPRDELFPYLGEFVQRMLDLQKKRQLYSLIHTNYWLEAWIGMELKRYQVIKQVHTNQGNRI